MPMGAFWCIYAYFWLSIIAQKIYTDVQDASDSTSSTDDADKTQQYEVCSGAWSAFFK